MTQFLYKHHSPAVEVTVAQKLHQGTNTKMGLQTDCNLLPSLLGEGARRADEAFVGLFLRNLIRLPFLDKQKRKIRIELSPCPKDSFGELVEG